MKSRFALLAGAATLAALVAPEAMAQTAPATGSDEIVVTAQRRAERAQDVPIVVTAYSSEQLSKRNVTQAQDLYGTAPSLVVGNQGQATRDVQSFSIRGQSTGFLASPAVAQYFAEVPLPASVSLNLQGAPGLFVDLENVQVLSGPQGTLFGRNTTGGAVLFVPKKPSDKIEGYVEGSLGNYKLRSVEGALNLPLISDKLMIRVAGTYHDRDGFTRDIMFNKNRDNQHYYAGRISILARPVEGLSNLTIIHGVKSSNNGTGFIHQGYNIPGLKGVGFCADPGEPFGPLALPCDAYRGQTNLAQQIGPRQTRLNTDEFSNIDMWGVINTTELDLNDTTKLRNIISYQRLRDNYAADQDATPIQQYELNQNSPTLPPGTVVAGLSAYGVPLFGYTNAQTKFVGQRDDIKQFTEELQVQGSALDKHLDYSVGFFHYSAVPGSTWGGAAINYCPALFTGLCGYNFSQGGVTNKSDAVYAQGTLNLGVLSPSLEKLRLTAGARHTWDTVEGYAVAWRPSDTAGAGFVSCLKNGLIPDPAVPDASKLTACRFDASLKSKAVTWTIGLDYKPTNNIMVYGKVSRGYKAGGFNSFAVRPETRTFEPEQLTSYEIGFKSNWRLGEMPVKLNATYYYSDYNNIQRPTGDFNPATSGNGARILAAKARIQGIELEGSIRPVTGLELGGNFSYTDPKYKQFDVPIFAPTVTCSGVKNFGQTGDFTCMPFQFVTKYIYNVYASLDLPVGENLGDLSFYVNYSHVSAQGTAPLGNAITQPGSVLDGFGLLNASITWKRAAGSPVDLSVFGTNLTDSLYRTSNSNTFDNLLVRSTVYGEPRMYGVKARVNF